MNKNILAIAFAFVIMFTIVIAQPPLIQTPDNPTLEIAYPQYRYVPINNGFQLNIHVINATGEKNSSTTGCELHLFNPNGSHTCFNALDFMPVTRDYSINITSGNFSLIGEHAFYIQCNSSNEIGFANGVFFVNGLGEELELTQAYIYLLGFVSLILLQIFLYIITTFLPAKDVRNDDNEIIQVSQLKHLRGVLWMIIWALALAEMFIVMNLSYAYLWSSMITGLFFAIYTIMFYVIIIGLPIYFFYIVWKFFRDREFQKMIERGVGYETP